jgi:hypothetical protein
MATRPRNHAGALSGEQTTPPEFGRKVVGNGPSPPLKEKTLGDSCFEAMVRHAEHQKRTLAVAGGGSGRRPPPPPPPPPSAPDEDGDIVWSARGIAKWLFGDERNAARKRVFHLWDLVKQQREEDEAAGRSADEATDTIPFFRVEGTLCLSKSEFRAWLKRQLKRKD